MKRQSRSFAIVCRPQAASIYTGLRFAQQAMALDPEDRDAQILFLALDFAWDAQEAKEARA